MQRHIFEYQVLLQSSPIIAPFFGDPRVDDEHMKAVEGGRSGRVDVVGHDWD